jgi:hypothetical protein
MRDPIESGRQVDATGVHADAIRPERVDGNEDEVAGC